MRGPRKRSYPPSVNTILKLLIDRGITQASIAAKYDVDRSTVNQVIHGRQSKRLQEAIAKELGVSVEALFDRAA